MTSRWHVSALFALSGCTIPSRASLTHGHSADASVLADGEVAAPDDGASFDDAHTGPTTDADGPAAVVDAGPDGGADAGGEAGVDGGPMPVPPVDPCNPDGSIALSFDDPDVASRFCFVDVAGGGTLEQLVDDAGTGFLPRTPALPEAGVASARGGILLWTVDSGRPFPQQVHASFQVVLGAPAQDFIADHIEWFKLQQDVGIDGLIPGVGLLLWGTGHLTAGVVIDNLDLPTGDPDVEPLFKEFETPSYASYDVQLDIRFGNPGSLALRVNDADVAAVSGSYRIERSARAKRLYVLLGLDSHGAAASGIVYRNVQLRYD